jgi:phenylacetate-coenzyme A ligase PaaK-like adenylate-forming protein
MSAGMTLPLLTTAGPLAAVSTLLQSTLRVEKEQRLPAEELAARRQARLQHVLARAAKTRYYGAALREIGITDPANFPLHQIERLPFLDRQLIAKHGLDAFLTVEKAGLIDVMTSGSTGTPGHFLRHRLEEADYSARWWRVYSAFGCRAWDSQINVAIVNKPDRAGPITLLRRIGVLPRIERLASDAPSGAGIGAGS